MKKNPIISTVLTGCIVTQFLLSPAMALEHGSTLSDTEQKPVSTSQTIQIHTEKKPSQAQITTDTEVQVQTSQADQNTQKKKHSAQTEQSDRSQVPQPPAEKNDRQQVQQPQTIRPDREQVQSLLSEPNEPAQKAPLPKESTQNEDTTPERSVTKQMPFAENPNLETENTNLEQKYLNHVFYEGADAEELYAQSSIFLSSFSGSHGLTLLQNDPNALAIYHTLEEKIQTVAETGGSTEFKNIPLDIPVKTSGNAFPQELQQSISKAITCLRVDIPEYIYWMDFSTSYRMSGKTNSNRLFTSISITLPVAQPYQQGNSDHQVNNKMERALQAKRNALLYADEIRQQSNLNTMEKIRAIKNKICSLTSYNFQSDGVTPVRPSKTSAPWSDAWQMVWVFDNDPSTNVVCEGYAKSFQYLFDLVFLGDPSVQSYCVTGHMNGGKHMWNIIQMGGQNYLVDVVGCDNNYRPSCGGYSNNSGWFVNADGKEDQVTGADPTDRVAGDGLFMLSTRGQLTKSGTYGKLVTVSGNVSSGYIVVPSKNSRGVLYTYNEETKSLYQNTNILDITYTGGAFADAGSQTLRSKTHETKVQGAAPMSPSAKAGMMYRSGPVNPFAREISQAKDTTAPIVYDSIQTTTTLLSNLLHRCYLMLQFYP